MTIEQRKVIAEKVARFNARNGYRGIDCIPTFIEFLMTTANGIRKVTRCLRNDVKKYGETDDVLDAIWDLEGMKGCIE